jgi:hypothetical protein
MKQSSISEKTTSSKLPINRGVELILAGGRPKPRKVRPFFLRVDRMVSFLKREIRFTFEVSLSIKKPKTTSGEASWKR